MTWDPSCTTILCPTDAKCTTMTISTYNFEEALWGLFPIGSKNDEQLCLENVVRLSAGAFKIQLSAVAFEYIKGAGTRPFGIGPFGT